MVLFLIKKKGDCEMKTVLFFSFMSMFLLIGSMVSSETNVDQIVENANRASYYQGDDGRAKVLMEIKDNQGRVREREFVILRKDKVDLKDQFFYLYFLKPADVRKMSFMVHKHVDKDDDRWLYLPSIDLVKRIAASDKRTSFVGSDFLYEDVSGRNPSEDQHVLESEDDQYYVLMNQPKDLSSVEFEKYRLWIDKNTFLPMKAEYFKKNEYLYRRIQALKVENIAGYPTVTESLVENFETQSTTNLKFTNVEYDLGLDESLFFERYLRRAPKEVKI